MERRVPEREGSIRILVQVEGPEGEGIVAEGRLDEQGVLIATQVLAKHDENYMPPEVAAALEGNTPRSAAPYQP